MIDGIKIEIKIDDFTALKNSVKVPFTTSVAVDTGELRTRQINGKIITTHRCKWENFDLTVKEVFNKENSATQFHLIVRGSLHKNHYGGENYQPFNYNQLQTEIDHLCKTLLVDPFKVAISNLEVGLNLKPDFIVSQFISENVLSYKGTRFNRFDDSKSAHNLGAYAALSQSQIKIYNKGSQYNLPYELMRVEKKFKKMQGLKTHGIYFLSDLQQKSKVEGLKDILTDVLQDTLLYDSSINLDNKELKPRDCKLLLEGSNPIYWEKLKQSDLEKYKYQRKKFRDLIKKHGSGQQEKIMELMTLEWKKLFKNSPILPKEKTHISNKKFTDFTIKIKGQYGGKRYCLSCSKDISFQKIGSRFCGAKFVGEYAAHKCRNKASNFNQKTKRLLAMGLTFRSAP